MCRAEALAALTHIKPPGATAGARGELARLNMEKAKRSLRQAGDADRLVGSAGRRHSRRLVAAALDLAQDGCARSTLPKGLRSSQPSQMLASGAMMSR
jgi:hypothetical protein